MGTRTVRLSDEVYELVEARKNDDETVSEAVERLIRQSDVPLTTLAGTVDEERGEAMKEAIARSRQDERAKLTRLSEKRGSTTPDDS